MKIALLPSLAILLAVNIFTTRRLRSNDELSPTQKNAQTLIIWLIPLLGSLLVLYFLNDADRNEPPSKPPFGGGSNENIAGQ